MWEYNYICHHGIKGQKWGIRRYQNKDGSLTPAGLRRRAKLQKQLDELSPKDSTQNGTESNTQNGTESNTQNGTENNTVPKKISELTNEELKEKTERLRLENDYKQKLQDSAKFIPKPEQVSAGRDWVKTFDNIGKAATSISTFTTQGIQVYNNYARIMNSLRGSNKKYIAGLPNSKEIKEHNQKKDEKKDD